jgi:hypothetical protein
MNRDLLSDPGIDWSSCTFDGARLKNHLDFLALPFAEKLSAIEKMSEFALGCLELRKRRGEPYIDPYTHQLVRSPKPAASPNPK